MALRILVVDDFEPWRRFVSSTFQQQKDLQILFEVSDGLEAVYRGEDLRPDLILLDIGLPRLNGIKAAQRIREVSPNSKILFLSEENSPDIAEAALEAGGVGYLVKSDAGRELLAAMKAVSEGKRYMSARLVGQAFFAAPDGDTSGVGGLRKVYRWRAKRRQCRCCSSDGDSSAGPISETADARLRSGRHYQEWQLYFHRRF